MQNGEITKLVKWNPSEYTFQNTIDEYRIVAPGHLPCVLDLLISWFML